MNNTNAIILKDSIDKYGNRLTTFRLTYPRIILSEVNTHKMLSKNTSSSRAIPVLDNIERVLIDPFIPEHWVKNSKGMYSLEHININSIENIESIWLNASNCARKYAKQLFENELHKQYANRLLEPFMYVDTILSGTDFDNFFHLRISSDAQPEIQLLASLMYKEYMYSKPVLLKYGQWHLPYIDIDFDTNGEIQYSVNNTILDLDTAIKISVSCCGQVSYRKLNTSIEKALQIYDKFVSGKTVHASALEHASTPFSDIEYNARLEAKQLIKEKVSDITDLDLEKFLYKRNFKGWTQYRTLVPNETFTKMFKL